MSTVTQPLSPHRTARILIVDDEADLRELLELSILRMGHEVETAATVTQAMAKLRSQQYQLVLTDMRLPDGLGLEIVRHLAQSAEPNSATTPVAVITAYGSADNAVEALKAGAFDYVAKPIALDQLKLLVQNALGVATVEAVAQPKAATTTPQMLGQSTAMDGVRATLKRFATSMAPVVIYGESGSGKERAARTIHEGSARHAQAFVPVNCGAIPENLMEAEFFGYVKGAFTGAEKDRKGFFQAAHGGTLLLDEVAELPLSMQVKLLRAIQERRVRKVGATTEEPVDVRILCATHKDLAQMVAAGQFRQDLYYRLNVLSVMMPPLRERPDDVLMLAKSTLQHLAERYSCAPKHLSHEACQALQAYTFPGNVRELENVLERAWAFSEGELIQTSHLGLSLDTAAASANSVPEKVEPVSFPEVLSDAAPTPLAVNELASYPPVIQDGLSREALQFPIDLPHYLAQAECRIIEQALEQTGFNRTHAAKLLGLSFRQLRYRMQQLGIREDKGTEGVDAQGWWAAAQRLPSPNFDARPRGTSLDLIVLHNISLPPGEFGGGQIAQFFTNQLDSEAHPYFKTIAGVRVSAHFLITRLGVCTQFVACQDRAWHAGLSDFMGRDRCNDFSIGIELEGTDIEPFTPEQYDTLLTLIRALLHRYPTIRALAGHSDIAPSRKTDPGPCFDWAWLAEQSGLAAHFFPYGLQGR